MSRFPSTLIIASSSQSALKKAMEFLFELNHLPDNNPDLFVLDDYTIARVRFLKNFLSQKPYNHQSKIVFIPDADNLNPESQNALLKTLEEPGKNNYLILTTTKPQLLLPTILSRCQKVKLNSQSIKNETPPWPVSGDIKKDLDYAFSLYTDKNEIKPLLLTQLEVHQQQFVSNPNPKTAKIIKDLITALKFIDANVDPKSALDYFFLR